MSTRNPHLASKLACSLLVLVGAWVMPGICWNGDPPAIQAHGSPAYDVAATSAAGANPASLDATVQVTADQYAYLPLVSYNRCLRYVATWGTDSGDCTNPNSPCATVQYAVDQAWSHDEIRVAAGVYTDVQGRHAPTGYQCPATGEIITQVVYIDKTVTIRGGYPAEPGRGTPAFADPPDPVSNPTTLDAGGRGRVLFITGNVDPTIEGLRITGGDAAGLGGFTDLYTSPRDAGGGVYAYGAAPLFRNNQVFSNTAECGGGLYLYHSVATLSANVVSTNTATANLSIELGDEPTAPLALPIGGGGLYLDAGNATLGENVIAGNTAAGFYYSGGGLCLYNNPATLSGNVIAGNTASRYGGGLHAQGSTATLRGNRITANRATHGGGVSLYAYDASMLNANTITANMADYGGGMYLEGSYATLTNGVIADNQASVAGSGLYGSDFVGGTHYCESMPNLIHVTIARNGGGDGSGIYCEGYWVVITLRNTILVSHTVGIVVGPECTADLEGTLWGAGANGTDWAGAGAVVTGTVNVWGDPGFVDPASGDYHIGPGSDAIDAGVDAGVATDMDGDPRPAGAGYDIGADERVEP